MGAEAATGAIRFSGFADLYDQQRPEPPGALGPLLVRYCEEPAPTVVDLGSGTGLSSRWAGAWATQVVGIEPSADMRRIAEARPRPNVEYHDGTSADTGLATASADVVLAVQAMHWMDPEPTISEVARLLRPGGVFAIVDADWPPVTGVVMAEVAWARLHNRIRVLEARAGAGRTGPDLARPVGEAELVSAGDDLADPHRDRVLADGVTSWAKGDHLARLVSSGRFRFTRELVFHDPLEGGAARVVALMRSQGGYQALRRLGLSDGVIGMTGFERDVEAGFAGASGPLACVLSWRVRMGVV